MTAPDEFHDIYSPIFYIFAKLNFFEIPTLHTLQQALNSSQSAIEIKH